MEFDDLEFDHDYTVMALDHHASPSVDHTFARKEAADSGTAGINVRIPVKSSDQILAEVRTADGGSWRGLFEPFPEGISGLFGTPNSHIICVIATGQGFWVPVNAPERFDIIRSVPIKQVIPVAELALLVFVDYDRVTGYAAEGFSRQTPSLSFSGIRVDRIQVNVMHGDAWDAPNGRHVEFRVDLRDGSLTGGSSPDLLGLL